MTQKEISLLLGYDNIVIVNNAFREATKIYPEIAAKNQKNRDKYSIEADYTIEECLLALPFISYWNPMLSRYLKEHFMEGTPELKNRHYVKLDYPARHCISQYAFGYEAHCCCNCEFLVARSFNKAFSRLYPYCSWYEVFLNKYRPKINIHFDRCPTYIKSDRPPLILTSDGLYPITQIEKTEYGYLVKENKTMLGIPNDKFKSSHKKGEPIVILKDMYAEDD